ncbi:MAG: hypothetical protein KC621_33140, partial [Myxococcales bacterium]|nr:hypothetical protein [Myxococcales bacterium]
MFSFAAWMLPAAFALTVDAPPSVIVGRSAEVLVSGASPGDTVYLVAGGSAGGGPCPVGLGGPCLDIAAPLLLGQQVAGP